MANEIANIEAQETAQQAPAVNAEAQATAVENVPTDLGTNDQASASAAGDAQPKETSIKSGFKKNSIYHLLEKNEAGSYLFESMKICYIKSNRKDKKQISDKVKSLQEVGMLIPGRFANPLVAFKAGYVLLDVWDDHILTEQEAAEFHAVIQEANTRFWGFKKIYDDAVKVAKKADENAKLEGFIDKLKDYIFFYVEYPVDDNGIKQFKSDYHQMNACNCQTKIKNFVDDYLATQTNDVLSSYQDKVNDGLLPKAATFATTGKEVSKGDIEKLFSGVVPGTLQDSSILEFTDKIYDAANECFGTSNTKCSASLKGAAVWKWTGSKLLAKDADKASVTEKIVSMFTKKDANLINSINNSKATDKQTKEQVVAEILDGFYSMAD